MNGTRRAALHHRGERDAVVAGLVGVLDEQAPDTLSIGDLSSAPSSAATILCVPVVSVPNTLLADAGEHQPVEAVRLAASPSRSSVIAPSEKPIASTGSVGQRVDDPRRQVGVRLRIVRLRGCAVAEQVDADDLLPGVARAAP